MISEPIRLEASTLEHAESLSSALERYRPAVVKVDESFQVEINPAEELQALFVELFDAIGSWLAAEGLSVCAVHFANRAYALVAQEDGRRGDPAQFLLERTLQLQTALESRIVIEQAKGILAQRYGIGLETAFELIRRAARDSRCKLHDVARDVVSSPETPEAIEAALRLG